MKQLLAIFILCIAFCGGAKAQFEDNPCVIKLPEGYYDTDSPVFKENKELADKGDPVAQYIMSEAYNIIPVLKAKKKKEIKMYKKLRDKYHEMAKASNNPEVLYSAWLTDRSIDKDKPFKIWQAQNTAESNYKFAYATLNRLGNFLPTLIIDFADTLEIDIDNKLGVLGCRYDFDDAPPRWMWCPDVIEGYHCLLKSIEQGHQLAPLALDSLVHGLLKELQFAYNMKDSLDFRRLKRATMYSFYFTPIIGNKWFKLFSDLYDRNDEKTINRFNLCIKECQRSKGSDKIERITPEHARIDKYHDERKAEATYMLGWWYFISNQQQESLKYIQKAAQMGDRWAKLHLEILDKYNFNF